MNIQRVRAVVLRQWYLIRGSFTRVLPLFVWASIDIVLWGFLTKYLSSVTSPAQPWGATLLGAVLLWGFFTRVMHGIAMALFEDVWSRNFLNLFTTPLTVNEYVAGLITTGLATSFFGLVVMLILAFVCFGLSVATYGVALFPFLFILCSFGIALGIAASAFVMKLGPAAEWFVWPIPMLISPFVGVFYPISVLPMWMQYVGKALPPSYLFEAMRSVVLSGQFDLTSLVIGSVLSTVYVMIAAYFFTFTFRQAIRSGLLARYGVESTA